MLDYEDRIKTLAAKLWGVPAEEVEVTLPSPDAPHLHAVGHGSVAHKKHHLYLEGEWLERRLKQTLREHDEAAKRLLLDLVPRLTKNIPTLVKDLLQEELRK